MDGAEREELLRIVSFAESDRTIAGLHDASADKAYERLPTPTVAVNCVDLKDSTLTIRQSKTDQVGGR